jgi:hypothetical protein
MLYKMTRIELAHPGSIMPPQGLRKWSVEVEFMGGQEGNEYCYVDDYWCKKAEIIFTDTEFIFVLCRLNEIVASGEHFKAFLKQSTSAEISRGALTPIMAKQTRS